MTGNTANNNEKEELERQLAVIYAASILFKCLSKNETDVQKALNMLDLVESIWKKIQNLKNE